VPMIPIFMGWGLSGFSFPRREPVSARLEHAL
jgi:hypothetical protein